MIFEQDKSVKNVGKKVGYVVGYFIFTTILYFILDILNKIPESWNYFHIVLITLVTAVVGYGLKRALK